MMKRGPSKPYDTIAEVVSIDDPKKTGRVRLRLQGFHDGVSDEDLPWALNRENSRGKASLDLPPVGTKVWADASDPHEPRFGSNVISEDSLPDFLKENYPHRRGYVGVDGTESFHDTQTSEHKLTTPTGVISQIDPAGKMLHFSPVLITGKVGELASSVIDPTSVQHAVSGITTRVDGATKEISHIAGAAKSRVNALSSSISHEVGKAKSVIDGAAGNISHSVGDALHKIDSSAISHSLGSARSLLTPSGISHLVGGTGIDVSAAAAELKGLGKLNGSPIISVANIKSLLGFMPMGVSLPSVGGVIGALEGLVTTDRLKEVLGINQQNTANKAELEAIKADVATGSMAPYLTLAATPPSFNFENNLPNPTDQSITITVARTGVTAGTTSEWTTNPPGIVLTGTGDARELAVADMQQYKIVTIFAKVGNISSSIDIHRIDKTAQATYNQITDTATTLANLDLAGIPLSEAAQAVLNEIDAAVRENAHNADLAAQAAQLARDAGLQLRDQAQLARNEAYQAIQEGEANIALLATAAQLARDAAQQAYADGHADIALLSAAALQARNEAQQAYADGQTNIAAVQAAVEAARLAINTARDAVNVARNEAVGANSDSQAARNAALLARDEAFGARDLSATYLQTVRTYSEQILNSGSDSLIQNGRFASWPSGQVLPNYWLNQINADAQHITKLPGELGVGNSIQMNSVAGQQLYFVQETSPALAKSQQWIVLEFDVLLQSGTLAGAGILFRTYDKTSTYIDLQYPCSATPDTSGSAPGAGMVGTVYRYRILTRVPALNVGKIQIFVMAHWDNFGSLAQASSLVWYRANYRAATDAEILAQAANKTANEATASIIGETAVRVGETSALAARASTLEAQVGNTAGSGLSARIHDEEIVRATQTDALALRSSTLEAQLRGETGSTLKSSIHDEELARVTADSAIAVRTSSIESTYNASGSTSSALNDRFANWSAANPYPSYWSTWQNAGTYSISRVSPGLGSPYAVSAINDSANAESGFYQTLPMHNGMWVMEATVRLDAGSISGAGMTLSGYYNVDFLTDPDTNGHTGDSVLGEVRSWTKLFSITNSTALSNGNGNLHAMLGWSNFPHTLAAKHMTWYRLAIRPATDGEIQAGKATSTLINTSARISTEEQTRTSETSALALRANTLESQFRGETGSTLQSRIHDEEITRTTQTAALAYRASTLESQINTAGTGLTARISAEEITRTTQTDALASRSNTIESQLRNESGSGLQSRIYTEEFTRTTLTDSLAVRANTLESQFRGETGSAIRSRIAVEEAARATADDASTIRVDNAVSEYRKNNFDTNARVGTEEQTRATADGALATRSTVIESRSGNTSNYANANASFTAWPDGAAIPSQWEYWRNNGVFDRPNSSFQNGAYTLKHDVFNTADAGLYSNLYLTAGYWVIEASVWCQNGNFQGAGVFVENIPALNFATVADSTGYVGPGGPSVRNWSFMVKSTIAVGAKIYLMTNWGSFGTTTVKTLHWIKCGVRPASDGEVQAGKATQAITDAVARINTEEITRTGLTDALANRATTLESQVNLNSDSPLYSRLRTEETTRTTATDSLANRNTTLESAAGRGLSINLNPNFQSYPSPAGPPPSWQSDTQHIEWVNRVVGENNVGYGVTTYGAAGNVVYFAALTVPGSISYNQYYVLEAVFLKESGGDLLGRGVLFREMSPTYQDLYDHYLNFATDPDISGNPVGAGVNGTIYRFAKMFRIAHGSASVAKLFAMGNWEGFVAGGPNTATLRWYRVALRPASDAEIAGAAAKVTADSAIARISTEETTRTSETGALATRVGTVESQFQGNTPSPIFTRIKNEEQTRATAYDALATRSTNIESSYNASGSTSSALNDRFANWLDANAYPAYWSKWVGPPTYRIARVGNGIGSPTALATLCDDHGSPSTDAYNSGFVQTVTAYRGYMILEATVRLDAGTYSGAGVTLGGAVSIDFLTDPDTNGVVGSGNNGVIRSWSKLVNVTIDFANNLTNLHGMVGWSAFNHNIDAKYLTWYRVAFRPATDGEIQAGKATSAITAAVARIGVEETTRTSQTGALANRATTLESQFNTGTDSPLFARLRTEETTRTTATDALANRASSLESGFQKLNPGANLMPPLSEWTGIGGSYVNVFWGPVITWSGTSGDYEQQFAVSPKVTIFGGGPYTLSADLLAYGASPSVYAYADIVIYDSNNNLLYDSNNILLTNQDFSANRPIGLLAVTFYAPANSSFAFIRLVGNARGGSAQIGIRKVKLEIGDHATPYSDDATIVNSSARIKTEEITRSTADSAMTSRVDNAVSEYRKNNSDTNARVGTEEQTRASADGALATRTGTLETRSGNTSNYANSNASFTAWPDGAPIPSQWYYWNNNGTFDRLNSSFQTGNYTFKNTISNGADSGLYTNLYLTAGYWVIEASAWCETGNFQGAGVFVENIPALNFSTVPDINGGLGVGGPGVRNWSFMVQSTFTGGAKIYLMTNWSSFGTTTAKSLHWIKCGVRPATDGEIQAGKATPALADAVSRIRTEEITRTGLTDSLANRANTLESQVNLGTDSPLYSRLRVEETTRTTATDSLAARNTTLESASGSGLSIFQNSNFQNYPNPAGPPPSWQSGTSHAEWVTRTVGENNVGYAVTTYGAAGNTVYFSGMSAAGSAAYGGYFVVEAVIYVDAGSSLEGSGVLIRELDYQNVVLNDQYLNFAYDPDSSGSPVTQPNLGRTYRFAKLLRLASPYTHHIQLFAMGNWDGFKANRSNTIVLRWYRVALRPASDAEIAGAAAKVIANDAIARIGTEEGTRITAVGAVATRVSTMESQFLGNTPSPILSRISNEENTRSTADTAIANRTYSLETRAGNTSNYANANANFSAWPDGATIPSQWNLWYNSTFERAQSGFQQGGYLVKHAVPADLNAGLSATFYVTAGYWVYEAYVWCSAGSFQGAGMYADDLPALNFSTVADSTGYAGIGGPSVRSWSYMIYSPKAGNINLYLMSNWDGFGARAAKTLYWAKCGIRPASDGEVQAGKATPALSAAVARIGIEETTRSAADSALANRAATLESQLTLGTDSALYARIRTEETTRTTAVSQLAGRTDSLEARSSGGGNLLSNTDFVTTKGWSPEYTSSNISMGTDAAGANWHPANEHVLSIVQSDEDQSSYGQWHLDAIIAVSPGQWIQTYCDIMSHRAAVQIYVTWYDGGGGVFGYAETGARYDGAPGNGLDISNYHRHGWKALQVPNGVYGVALNLRKFSTYPGQSNSYAWFLRPYLGMARAGQNEWNPYTPGSAKAELQDARALITSESVARTTKDDSLTGQINTAISEYRTNNSDTNVRVNNEVGTRAAADTAIGIRTSSIESTYNTVPTAAVSYNERFSNWPDPASYPRYWQLWANGGNYTFARSAGIGSAYAVSTYNDIGEVSSGFYQGGLFVSAGYWVIEATIRQDAGGLSGSGVSYNGRYNLSFLTDPDINGYAGNGGQGQIRSWSKLIYVVDDRTDNLYAMTGWEGFGQSIHPKYLTWFRVMIRPATDGEIKGMQAKATTEANTARIAVEEQTRATAVQGLATRTSTLEGTAGNLVSRVTTNEGAVADLRGRTYSYWTTSAVSGNNRAQISIHADANGGAGVDIVGDTTFYGNLAVGVNASGARTTITNQGVRVYNANGTLKVQLGNF